MRALVLALMLVACAPQPAPRTMPREEPPIGGSTCEDLARRRDLACESAKQVCELAQQSADADAMSRCGDARLRCDNLKERVEDQCNRGVSAPRRP